VTDPSGSTRPGSQPQPASICPRTSTKPVNFACRIPCPSWQAASPSFEHDPGHRSLLSIQYYEGATSHIRLQFTEYTYIYIYIIGYCSKIEAFEYRVPQWLYPAGPLAPAGKRFGLGRAQQQRLLPAGSPVSPGKQRRRRTRTTNASVQGGGPSTLERRTSCAGTLKLTQPNIT